MGLHTETHVAPSGAFGIAYSDGRWKESTTKELLQESPIAAQLLYVMHGRCVDPESLRIALDTDMGDGTSALNAADNIFTLHHLDAKELELGNSGWKTPIIQLAEAPAKPFVRYDDEEEEGSVWFSLPKNPPSKKTSSTNKEMEDFFTELLGVDADAVKKVFDDAARKEREAFEAYHQRTGVDLKSKLTASPSAPTFTHQFSSLIEGLEGVHVLRIDQTLPFEKKYPPFGVVFKKNGKAVKVLNIAQWPEGDESNVGVIAADEETLREFLADVGLTEAEVETPFGFSITD